MRLPVARKCATAASIRWRHNTVHGSRRLVQRFPLHGAEPAVDIASGVGVWRTWQSLRAVLPASGRDDGELYAAVSIHFATSGPRKCDAPCDLRFVLGSIPRNASRLLPDAVLDGHVTLRFISIRAQKQSRSVTAEVYGSHIPHLPAFLLLLNVCTNRCELQPFSV